MSFNIAVRRIKRENEIPICPTNGFISFSKCNQTTKHCDADPSMSCYEIDGTQWCCDPPLEDRDCYDIHSHCRKFEHFCSSVLLDDTMRDLCPKTCGFCTPKTKSNDKPDDNKCIDNNNNCQELEDLCHSNDISDVMRFDCKKTCGFCGNDVGVKSKDPKKPEQCVDTNPNCPKLTDLCNDESQFTQDLMKTQCKHSCGFCKGGETLQQPKIPDNDCVDLNVNCQNVADVCNNDNVELRNLMKSQCQKNLRILQKMTLISSQLHLNNNQTKEVVSTTTTTAERIKGMCKSSEPYVRTFMLQKCQKTCGLCNNKQKNQTKASKSVNKH
ncbi:hypothetical protein M3Y97_01102700 [Aphelenchoides bicaudatus]|nr:hypothetical protein M3Y97_01102700 [Aphelenchoides bicaudatus]